MLAAIKYKQEILETFYLDDDDITIRRKKTHKYFKNTKKKGDIVEPYSLIGNGNRNYKGIHLTEANTTISLPWMLVVLRGMDFDEKTIIDHINGDISDNSRSNLRLTTQSMNCRNTKQRCDNTSGYTGLTYHKPTGRWVVRRQMDGKRVWKSSKSFDKALEIWKEIDKISKESHGYTERHGKL